MPIAAVALFVIVAAVAAVALRRGAGVAGLSEGCRDIQRAIATLPANAPPDQRRVLEAQLRNCAADLAARGIAVDMSEIALGNARNTAGQIEATWSDYLATDYTDIIGRKAKMGHLYQLLDSLVASLLEAARNATTSASMTTVRTEIQQQMVRSLDRALCRANGGSGCGRYGYNEDDWDVQMLHEMQHGAFALGLRDAIRSGWRSPRDIGDGEVNAPAWAAYRRALPSGNVPPADLYRIGELARAIHPTWDDFGGGPHYHGAYLNFVGAWNASPAVNPYDVVKPLRYNAGAVARAARPLSTFRPTIEEN